MVFALFYPGVIYKIDLYINIYNIYIKYALLILGLINNVFVDENNILKLKYALLLVLIGSCSKI
jgi:hypothetical protein